MNVPPPIFVLTVGSQSNHCFSFPSNSAILLPYKVKENLCCHLWYYETLKYWPGCVPRKIIHSRLPGEFLEIIFSCGDPCPSAPNHEKIRTVFVRFCWSFVRHFKCVQNPDMQIGNNQGTPFCTQPHINCWSLRLPLWEIKPCPDRTIWNFSWQHITLFKSFSFWKSAFS